MISPSQYETFSIEQAISYQHELKKQVNISPLQTPVHLSPGHKISTEQSVEIIRNCIRKRRIPKPTRLANLLVNKIRIADGDNIPDTLFG